MRRALPISEVKARLPELVAAVEEREEEIVVTRKGKPAAGKELALEGVFGGPAGPVRKRARG